MDTNNLTVIEWVRGSFFPYIIIVTQKTTDGSTDYNGNLVWTETEYTVTDSDTVLVNFRGAHGIYTMTHSVDNDGHIVVEDNGDMPDGTYAIEIIITQSSGKRFRWQAAQRVRLNESIGESDMQAAMLRADIFYFAKGDEGNGIEGIALTSTVVDQETGLRTRTYTISFTDGNDETYDIVDLDGTTFLTVIDQVISAAAARAEAAAADAAEAAADAAEATAAANTAAALANIKAAVAQTAAEAANTAKENADTATANANAAAADAAEAAADAAEAAADAAEATAAANTASALANTKAAVAQTAAEAANTAKESADTATANANAAAARAEAAAAYLVDEELDESSTNPVQNKAVAEEFDNTPSLSTNDDADLDIVDESSNVLARFIGGHIKTKNFDSSLVAQSNWKNKIIAWYGTSIPAGYPYQNNQDLYAYPNIIASALGATILNKCVPNGVMRATKYNGTEMSGARANLSFTKTTSAINYQNSMLDLIGTSDDPDLFVFDYGVNDIDADATELSEQLDFSYKGTNTFFGAFSFVLFNLFNAKPKARVIILTHYSNDGIQTSNSFYGKDAWKPMNDGIENFAKYWGVKLINAREFVGWHNTKANINAEGSNNMSVYVTDGIHPASGRNTEAVNLLADLYLPYIANFI